MVNLNQYLYLDDKFIDDNLAALKGGLPTQSSVSAKVEREGSGKAGVGIPGLGAKVAVSQATGTENHTQYVPTPASKFQELRALLDAERAIRIIEAPTDSGVGQLGRGAIIEVPVSINTPGFLTMLEGASQFHELASAIQQTGAELDQDAKQAMLGMSLVSKVFGGRPLRLLFQVPGCDQQKLVGQLKPDGCKVPRHELTGEATLVAKVLRTLQPGESYPLVDIMGALGKLPQAAALSAELEAQSQSDPEIAGLMPNVVSPGLVVHPIAIFV